MHIAYDDRGCGDIVTDNTKAALLNLQVHIGNGWDQQTIAQKT